MVFTKNRRKKTTSRLSKNEEDKAVTLMRKTEGNIINKLNRNNANVLIKVLLLQHHSKMILKCIHIWKNNLLWQYLLTKCLTETSTSNEPKKPRKRATNEKAMTPSTIKGRNRNYFMKKSTWKRKSNTRIWYLLPDQVLPKCGTKWPCKWRWQQWSRE